MGAATALLPFFFHGHVALSRPPTLAPSRVPQAQSGHPHQETTAAAEPPAYGLCGPRGKHLVRTRRNIIELTALAPLLKKKGFQTKKKEAPRSPSAPASASTKAVEIYHTLKPYIDIYLYTPNPERLGNFSENEDEINDDSVWAIYEPCFAFGGGKSRELRRNDDLLVLKVWAINHVRRFLAYMRTNSRIQPWSINHVCRFLAYIRICSVGYQPCTS